MKLSILKHMRKGSLYFREELGAFTKRIDFELAHYLESGEIIRPYQGIYAKRGSQIKPESIIAKIIKRDRRSSYLIIPAKLISTRPAGLTEKDYICLNSKRSDTVSTPEFKIKFQIPTHGFPSKLTDGFLFIYQMNTSDNPEELISAIDQKIIDDNFKTELKKYANKRAFKMISRKISEREEIEELSSELARIGAPLILEKVRPFKTKLSKEEIIAKASKIGMREPRIHNILPFTIWKNSKNINYKKLEALAKEYGTYRYIGLILDILKMGGFDEISEMKAPKYSRSPIILFENIYGRRGIERIQKKHLDFALDKWGILTDISPESEISKIRKWQ